MSDSYLDHIPSAEREKIRKRMRSPEAYERLREKVKGPEDLEKEMERSEKMAELSFEMESNSELKERVQAMIEKDIAEQGVEKILEATGVDPDMRLMIEQGKFLLQVSAHPVTHEDTLVIIPEGNIQEKIPVKTGFCERYVSQFIAH